MNFWQELKQVINLVLNAFLLIANSKHAYTAVRERRFLRKGKVSAILFPDLAEHNLFTIQSMFMRFLY